MEEENLAQPVHWMRLDTKCVVRTQRVGDIPAEVSRGLPESDERNTEKSFHDTLTSSI
jgi:hypothetical protein